MTRCAIYARYSSDLQSPTSIEDQVALCRAYAERQGWTVVATFEDAALSGFGVEQRPGYQQLIAAALAAEHPFEVILVEDLSRLTRDMAETLRLYHRLRLKGIDLVGVSDGIATSRHGAKVHLAVKGLVNELYLDDLRDKTHRGLTGRVQRGFSAGGRTFGYRTVPTSTEAKLGKGGVSARIEIEPAEAEIVRRIFRAYAGGSSMKRIVFELNRERVPFPAKDTKRGPARRGWALSSVQTILHNERYRGLWIWNKTRFLKDPDTGRRRPVPRPPDDWIRQERPELAIVDAELWDAVRARLSEVNAPASGRRGGPGPGAYSPYLLSGLLRCGVCGARMHAQTVTRRKRGQSYAYGFYVCGFAKDKGPTICAHRIWYRRDRLEGSILKRFREAMTPERIEIIARTVNAHLEAATRERQARLDGLKSELLRLELEAGNLVRALAQGLDSPTVRAELESTEASLAALRAELAAHERTQGSPPPVVADSVRARFGQYEKLIRTEPVRARREIAKHLDGDPVITPIEGREGYRKGATGLKRAVISGLVKPNSLLAAQDQEAVFASLVAGAGFEPATFGL
jgi:site-specific DNA recombinase